MPLFTCRPRGDGVGLRFPVLIAAVLGDIAKAKGMTSLAKETGLSRENLYRTLSSKGNPELSTFLKVVKALGYHLEIKPNKNLVHA